MQESDIALMKDLMWEHGLTLKEAKAYFNVVVSGMTREQYARLLNVSVSLITKRVKSAQAKIDAKKT